jgi:hypothetical protein
MIKNKKNDIGKYSIEFFHIYTDEKISARHTASVEYFKELQKSWSFPYEPIILIDNYNPKQHTLKKDDVIDYMKDQKIDLNFWAYEKDMIANAELLLSSLKSNKLLKGYRKYIGNTKKYPCSLLTAAWYLTRLGYIDSSNLIKSIKQEVEYKPASRLFNILPNEYKIIEAKAKELINNSYHSEAVDKIQNFYYSAENSRPEDLF